jgi:hypothetical protein
MRARTLLLVASVARAAAAQSPDSLDARGAIVSGVVRDSLAGAPLSAAMVQLVAADPATHFVRSAVTDSLGRFTLSGIPDGRFTLGFFHPLLDSIGIEAPLREVNVSGHHQVRADLSVPSATDLRRAICGEKPLRDSGAVLVGVVRDADSGAPVAGATVRGEWLELSFRSDGLLRRVPQLVATTGENGWFAMCDVPSAGMMALIASRGTDSTDLVDVQVPAEGFMRQELYIAATQKVAAADTAGRTSSSANQTPVTTVHTGNGRISGTVVRTAGGKPLAGARVGIINGPETRTNERGEWTLTHTPAGTRMLEVRAVGYYPERRKVDVVQGARPVKIALSTLTAVLDTIKVSASRRVFNRDSNGFEGRRRSGAGYYLTETDIARRQRSVTSDLFQTIPGLLLEGNGIIDRRVTIRGPFGRCTPRIYLNGRNLMGIDTDELDTWVAPNEIKGIEVYTEATLPAEFQQALNECGAIVIWTR